ncbi:MAG TPA: hypothetical protein VMS31_11360 [Pyrinomonadaceae bacterium]|nr:hypothetical protein [Pyrinomonadaceae bacterium]
MKVLDYLTPENPIARWIVYTLVALFLFWFISLLWSLWRHLSYRRQIMDNKDTAGVLKGITTDLQADRPGAVSSPLIGPKAFQIFLIKKQLPKRGPIARHLRAIFEAGWNESQLDVPGLIKNTSDELFRINSLHRSLLSIFIILGLLGTLFGLADTLGSLDTLLHGTGQLNNDSLGQSLQRLLGTLKSAFAPSIWGVSLTVLGVLIFAFYVRIVALPLAGLLERMTLTVWIPQLVPTTSQKLLEKLQLSEHQMQRSFEAAQEVAEFAESIRDKTGDFGQILSLASRKLKQMDKVAGELETFSKNFVEGVRTLAPFQQDLRSLYQQMADESRAFQASVQSNIAGSQEFQQQIRGQLNSQHEQMAQVLKALQSYEAAYIVSRGGIDEKLTSVLTKAELAYQSLSQRNDEIAGALDDALGKPLRENLTRDLGGVEAALQKQLGEVQQTLEVKLGHVGERLLQLDAPLNTAAKGFAETFSNFDQTTREWLERLQREFAKQNDTNVQQLQRLESLSREIPELLKTLSDSSNNFSQSSGSFAARGEQLSKDVSALSLNIGTLGKSVDSLSEQVTPSQPVPKSNAPDPALELLSQQTRLLQQLAKRIESLASSQSRRREVRDPAPDTREPSSVFTPKPRWRDTIRGWFRRKA